LAKIYGDRYENMNQPIGGGGQGDVLRVRDTLDPLRTEYALKRLKKADRYGRFLTEIEALQRINHPNVMRIVDNSGEAAPGDTKHKYWFVMPLAAGNLEDRIGLYKGDLDAVVKVTTQLADALIASHAQGIVHRDVKPPNILFPRLDHEVWLSDFGICHLGASKERYTETGEIVGPRLFIAPELERGGRIDVSPAADLYSLGKVIYYMLSGGGIIPREDLNFQEFDAAFTGGERHGLLRMLVLRLIAPIDRRIQFASKVREELRHIEEWEQHARTFALKPDALEAIDRIQRGVIDQARIREENERIHSSEQQLVDSVSSGVLNWVKAELDKTASVLGKTHTVQVSKVILNPRQRFGFTVGHSENYSAVDGAQIEFINPMHTFKSKFVLSFFVCKAGRVEFTIGNNVVAKKANDPQLALVPYVAELRPPDYKNVSMGGFLQDKAVLARSHAEFVARTGRRNIASSDPLVAQTFVGHPVNLMVAFGASEWPSNLDAVKVLFSEAVKVALEWSESHIRSVGA
jgi:serine/threonine protein kinase